MDSELENTQPLDCPQEEQRSGRIGTLLINDEEYPISCGPNRIGRLAHLNDICIDVPTVSAMHCIINAGNNDIIIMDLGSMNNTVVDNVILERHMPYPLEDGSLVQLGPLIGEFRLFEDENVPVMQAIEIPDTPEQQNTPEPPNASALE